MKSARQFVDDLLNIRLQATNVSLWHIRGTLTEPALRAVNDGIASYEAQVTLVYNSLGLTGNEQIVVLPRDIGRVVRLEVVGSTGGGRRTLSDYRHVRAGHTNLLYIRGVPVPYGLPLNVTWDRAELEYEPEYGELAPDVFLFGPTLTTAGAAFAVTGGSPKANWQERGYIELSWPLASTDVREVIQYHLALPTGFTGLVREVEGMAMAWTQGARVSPVYPAPDREHRTIMMAAQASMYEFWVRNRALYTEYTAVMSEQQLEVGDILAISRAFEDKAERTHKNNRTIMAPGQARVRVRRP